ncbi:hypothetical protein [Cysteiniphilum halobium]|uniref:hypothetical protein n=1 Tax=Cysteiniphilum halobium TaxID=2219059 RepID=UPI003F8392BF
MKRFNFFTSLLLTSLLCGCSLFNVKQHTLNNDDAKRIATHNLSVLHYCDVNNVNYLYVDPNGKTTMRNLFVYINDINEDLARSKLCYQALTHYNEDVISHLKD